MIRDDGGDFDEKTETNLRARYADEKFIAITADSKNYDDEDVSLLAELNFN